jgi:hypothetical protein
MPAASRQMVSKVAWVNVLSSSELFFAAQALTPSLDEPVPESKLKQHAAACHRHGTRSAARDVENHCGQEQSCEYHRVFHGFLHVRVRPMPVPD